MGGGTPIVARVDHIIVRTEDPRALFTLFTDTFELPVAWPLVAFPTFTSGGVGVGNTMLEFVRFGPPGTSPARPPRARLYGLAFEPAGSLSAVRAALAARRIPHSPPAPFRHAAPAGAEHTLWSTLVVGRLLGQTWTATAFFRLAGVLDRLPRRRGPTRAAPSPAGRARRGAGRAAATFLDLVFGDGLALLVAYDPTYYDPAQVRPALAAALRARQGGPLGVLAVREVVVGAPDLPAATRRWQRFLAPTPPAAPGAWRLGEGPLLRLVAHRRGRVQALVVQVASAARARAFLAERGLLRAAPAGELAIAPAALGGVLVRLVADEIDQ